MNLFDWGFFSSHPMALQNIIDLVKGRLPYLNNADDNAINSKTTEAFYFLQPQTKKSDADVETEANYKPLERMLISDLVSYWLLKKRITENVAGTGGSTTVTPMKIVKKGKADVTEAEFEIPKAQDGIFLGLNAEKLLEEIRKDLCAKAAQLNFYLPEICGEQVCDVIPAFKTYTC